MSPVRPLGFDFAAGGATSRVWGWVLLAVAAAFVADVVRSQVSLQGEVARLERRLAAAKRTPYEAPAGRPVAAPEEFAAARAVVARFARPWPELFSSIEAVRVEDVALLSIEPDAAAGRVIITGEAESYLAALTYVAQLSMQPGLTRAHLARHEVKTEQRRRVSFSVVADWGKT